MAVTEQSAFGLDLLYCEESIDNDEFHGSGIDEGSSAVCYQNVVKAKAFSFNLLEDDLFWDESELESLLSKEKETHPGFRREILDGSLLTTRNEAVDWILKVKTYFGFTTLTTVLAVNYFDRFVTSTMFQRDKPWMGKLAAVACISLAAKVEETYVPTLLDIQVEESKPFEAKNIKRMELLVLSTLQWKMHPVTPISFIDHIVRRLGLKTNIHWEFLRKCERFLLSVIADNGVQRFQPSVLATVTMMHVIREFQPWNEVEYQHQLLTLLRVNEDEVNACFGFIDNGSNDFYQQGLKRKNPLQPPSPNGVIDALYSSDSSNDSWSVAPNNSSSSMPLYKRSKSQDQQMRLPSLKRMYVDVLSSPH